MEATEQMEPNRTVVRHRQNGQVGMVSVDLSGFMSVAQPGQVPVRFEGQEWLEAVDAGQLQVVEQVQVQPDLARCGAGQGAQCCIFLTGGPDGPSCERNGSMHMALQVRRHNMTARRLPTQVWPKCMLEAP